MLYREDVIIYDDSDDHNKKKNHILDDLDDIEESENTMDALAPSKFQLYQCSDDFGKKKKKKKETVEVENSSETDSNSEWLDSIMSFDAPKKKHYKKNKAFSAFDIDENGKIIEGTKKKGKHKNKKGPANYRKEFETEATMLRTLYTDQSKFIDGLQKKYDIMNGTKSSARGIGKFTTDLIETISSSRNTLLSIVKEQISLKSKIADLSMKERKEFGTGDEAQTDNSLYASTFMNELLRTGHKTIVEDVNTATGFDDQTIDPDEMANMLSQDMPDDGINPYLQYENSGVEVYVVCNNDGSWHFEARYPDGNVADDYPLPSRSRMSFNKSTMMATDEHGRRYQLDVVDGE